MSSGTPAELMLGNAAAPSEEKARFRDWFVGDFARWAAGAGRELTPHDARERYGLRYTSAIEVKWSHHPAGEPRPDGWAPPGTDHTVGARGMNGTRGPSA